MTPNEKKLRDALLQLTGAGDCDDLATLEELKGVVATMLKYAPDKDAGAVAVNAIQVLIDTHPENSNG